MINSPHSTAGCMSPRVSRSAPGESPGHTDDITGQVSMLSRTEVVTEVLMHHPILVGSRRSLSSRGSWSCDQLTW